MLCEFVGGPENGQRDEVDDACREAYCTGLSREVVDWYERDPENPSRFLHRRQVAVKEYLARTKEARKLKEIEAAFSRKPEDMPEWAR